MNPTRNHKNATVFSPDSLTEYDWNFSAARVPDSEVIPCLLWEFMRESATVRQLANDWLEWFDRQTVRRPLGEKDADPKLLWPRTRAIKLKINYPILFDDFRSELPIVWGSKKMPNVPWQKLSPGARKRLARSCTECNKSVFIGYGHHALALNEHVNSQSEKEVDVADLARRVADGDRAARGLFDQELAKAVLPARALLRSFTKPLRSLRNSIQNQEALCVVVDWGRYDNNAIRADFAKLGEEIIKSRPKGIKPQVRKEAGRGNPNEWRGMLNSLGLARLSGRYTAPELRRKFPKVYAQIEKSLSYRETLAVQKKLNGATRRFLSRFHKILPFEECPPLCLRQSRTKN